MTGWIIAIIVLVVMVGIFVGLYFFGKKMQTKQEAQQESFSVVCVHAWSNFSDHGQTEDPLIENQSGDIRGAGAAKLCAGHLNDSFEVVNMQELVWRLRMSQRPEQTKKYLSEVF